MKKVLFVCLGNICRSPAAEAVLKMMAEKRGLQGQLFVTSCGIGDWHVGKPADIRMRKAATGRGIPINTKAKIFVPNYLEEFNYIFAADQDILEYLHRMARNPEEKSKIHLMTAFSHNYPGEPIPDPYYQGEAGFDYVMDLLEDSCSGFLDQAFKK
ncbi:MAG: low molecular weight protein-tyrosine-phosphatase [Parachlamydiaceae bacterium]